ncbi:MAG: class I SAM-dependent methyltransferase [Armatimonadota bacterium]
MNFETIRSTHQETGAAWDETAAIYERDEATQIEFLKAGGSTLLEPEQRILGDISSWCGRAIHLQCAGGSDTLSLLPQGAAEVVGIDISPRMIAVAERKTAALGAAARWFCGDVLEAPHELDGTADLVYTGRGALPWIMDIMAWADVVARLLRPRGRLFIFEGHPLDWVWDTSASEYRLDPTHGDYFATALNDQRWPMPFLEQQSQALKAPRAREHQWTLGDIINALISAGLTLERFDEHPDLYWNQFPDLPKDLARRLPHIFSILMRKA